MTAGLRSLVVGLGRSGAGLHLGALARAARRDHGPFADAPIVACDPRGAPGSLDTGVLVTGSLRRAADLVPVRSTVVHVCTPPDVRSGVLAELGELGFRRVIVEKPLATGVDETRRIVALAERYRMEIVVVAHWLHAELTARLHELVRGDTLGPLRRIRFHQHKPRFRRSLQDRGHRTAFDVEVPHSLGVALLLAGPAELGDARCSPLRTAEATLPWMGGARLELDHSGGVRTEIVSDLASPTQERSITLDFASGRAVGHYPVSDRDDHAQLIVDGRHEAFPDDALGAFVLAAYRGLRDHDPELGRAFRRHLDVVRLTDAARRRCRADEPATEATRAG